jgi:hypothetical protein
MPGPFHSTSPARVPSSTPPTRYPILRGCPYFVEMVTIQRIFASNMEQRRWRHVQHLWLREKVTL